MSPTLDAGYIRPGHQIRPPGESAWLDVLGVDPTTLGGKPALVIRTTPGLEQVEYRQFVTFAYTPWPCRIGPDQ